MCLAGCCSNTNQALYESIKTQNEVNKTPGERSMAPTPSYGIYKKERENLQQGDAENAKNESPDFNLK
jgi:hypothetical protein